MQEINKNIQSIQTSALFDETIPCIDCSTKQDNLVHKKSVTSIKHNNTKIITKFSSFDYKEINNITPQSHKCAYSLV
jgi:hypothetical protein